MYTPYTYKRHTHAIVIHSSQIINCVHNCRIRDALDRGSNTTRNGSAIWFTVSENPSGLMGASGSSDRRNAQRMSATLMKIERFAMCCAGHILCGEGEGRSRTGTRQCRCNIPSPEPKRVESEVISQRPVCGQPALGVKLFRVWKHFRVVSNCP